MDEKDVRAAEVTQAADTGPEGPAGEKPAEMSRVLGTGSLVIQGLAWLCPACIVVYYGIINQLTGGAFPLTIAIAGGAIFLTALSYASMSKKYTQGGSVYTFVGGSLGPRLGFMTGWLLILDYFILPMVCYISSGLYLNILFPAIPAWVFMLATIAFVFVCNYFGIKFATFINMIVVVVPIVMLIITIIFIIKFVVMDAPDTTGTLFSLTALMAPKTVAWSGVLQGSAIMCVMFVGFDVATNLAGEAKDAVRTVPKAVLIIVIYTAVSFFITGYLMNCGWEYHEGMLNDPNTAVAEYYVYLGLGWMNTMFVPVNTLACIGCCIAGNASSSRILYKMGTDGFLPKKLFGYIHPKHKTPSFNILLAALIGCCALLFQGQVLDAANFNSFGALLAFTMANICVVASYWHKDHRRGLGAVIKYLVIPLAAAAIDLFLWWQLTIPAKICGFSWLALGFILLLIRTKGFKELPPDIDFSEEE